ncbi:MAG: hypothetical protein ACP5EP_12865, partial [Acidobacteriaceae bacterium]
ELAKYTCSRTYQVLDLKGKVHAEIRGNYLGVEMDSVYHAAASARMMRIHGRIAARRSSCGIPTAA